MSSFTITTEIDASNDAKAELVRQRDTYLAIIILLDEQIAQPKFVDLNTLKFAKFHAEQALKSIELKLQSK